MEHSDNTQTTQTIPTTQKTPNKRSKQLKFDELYNSHDRYKILMTESWTNSRLNCYDGRSHECIYTFKQLFDQYKDDLSNDGPYSKQIPDFKFFTEDDFKKITSMKALISKINSFVCKRRKWISFYNVRTKYKLIEKLD